MLALFMDMRPSFHPDGADGITRMKPGLSILGHPWKNPKKITPIYFDASIREEHGIAVDLCDEAIEDGSTITDHARVQPEALTMDVIVSENKNRIAFPIATSFAPHHSPIGVWKTIKALTQGRRPFDVVTSLDVYTSMMAIRVSTPRTAETSHAMVFAVALRKVQLVTVDQIANMTEEAGNIGVAEQDMGAQAVADPFRQYATGLI